MEIPHEVSCGRRLARQIEAANGTKQQAATAIYKHCGVSLLRAHRIAHGFTLAEVAELVGERLTEIGVGAVSPPTHQTISRWEKGPDVPTLLNLDALCFVYRTRPDRLGFGRDYSEPEAGNPEYPILLSHSRMTNTTPTPEEIEDNVRRREFLRSAAMSGIIASTPYEFRGFLAGGSAVADPGSRQTAAVGLLEQRAEQSGYFLFSSSPAEFIPSRMIDFAGVQRLLLEGQSLDLQRRLHRIAAKNAGFIASRFNDFADIGVTIDWFRIARHEARQAQDLSLEAWIVGHMSDAYVCYRATPKRALDAARTAQAMNGDRPNAAAVYGYLIEAGIQARQGHRRETLEAVVQSDKMFSQLPTDAALADGIHVPEYFLRWHQSNALTAVGEGRLSERLRARALELPFAAKDDVGRALLRLDQASILFKSNQVDQGCHAIVQAWNDVPDEFLAGQIPRRTEEILGELSAEQRRAREVQGLEDLLRSYTPPASTIPGTLDA